jgi:hypothetical protein
LEAGALLIAEKAIAAVFPNDPVVDITEFKYQAVRNSRADPLVPPLLEVTLDKIYNNNMGGQALKFDDGSGAYWLYKSSTKEVLEAAQKELPLVWDATIDEKSDTLYEFPSFGEFTHVENIVRYNACVVDGLRPLSSLFGWKTAVCSSSRNCQILRIPLHLGLSQTISWVRLTLRANLPCF